MFDTDTYPFGKEAGANKYGMTKCPTCGALPVHPTAEEWPWPDYPIPESGFFLFRDELSAKEYAISAMCQSCQDSVFTATGD
jgi:hypothetical protein